MCRLHYDYMLGFQFAETVDTEIVEIRLWVKCGTAACGMRKVKCGMECAAQR